MAIFEDDLPVGIARGEYFLNGLTPQQLLAGLARAVAAKRFQPVAAKVIVRQTGDETNDGRLAEIAGVIDSMLHAPPQKFANFDFAAWADEAWANSDYTRWFETVTINGELFTLAVRFDEAGTTVTDLGIGEEWGISLLRLFPSLQRLQTV